MPIRSRDPLYHSFWAGVFASGALHVLVVGVAATAALLDIALPFLTIEIAPSRQIVLTASFAGPRETENEQRVWVELTNLAQTPRDDNEPAGDPESSAADSPAVDPSKTTDDVRESNNLGQFVKQRVEAAINEGQSISEQERLERLKKLSGKLGDVSTEKSLDGVADTLQKFLGTEKRAERPADKPVAGEFDFSTAQLHDVRREPLDDGRFRYTSVLVDADGRQLESAMDDAEGASAYEVMELIKGNPLLEKIYRSIVMSLLDKVTKEAAEK